nr:hypothetical protein [Tanacetum cinerariifolium]
MKGEKLDGESFGFVYSNGDGTSVLISIVFGRLRDMLTRNGGSNFAPHTVCRYLRFLVDLEIYSRAMVGPISLPVQFNVSVLAVLVFIESPVCRPPPVTTRAPHRFDESLGLTGSGVTNSSDDRVVTRADRTNVPISTVFVTIVVKPTYADLCGSTRLGSYVPINNRSRSFGMSPAVSSGGLFPVVNHAYLCLDVRTQSIRHQVIDFCPSNGNVPTNGSVSLNSSVAVNIEVVGGRSIAACR